MPPFKMSLLFKLARQYYPFNDAAHQYDHFIDVVHHYQTVIEPYIIKNIKNPRYQLVRENPHYFKEILISILAHDLFAVFRKNHETMAYHFVKSAYENFGCTGDVELLALAAKEHRASGSGEFTSLLSEIVATADKPFRSNNIDDMVIRCYQYAVSKLELSHDDAIDAVPEHLRNKFGRTGYIKYPPLWLEIYGSHLQELYVTLDNLTIDQVKHIVSNVDKSIDSYPTLSTTMKDGDIEVLSDWLIMAMTFMMQSGVPLEDNVAEINGYLKSKNISIEVYVKVSQIVFSKISRATSIR